MQANAVISADRRYVRITTIPFFSAIRGVVQYNLQTGVTSQGQSDAAFANLDLQLNNAVPGGAAGPGAGGGAGGGGAGGGGGGSTPTETITVRETEQPRLDVNTQAVVTRTAPTLDSLWRVRLEIRPQDPLEFPDSGDPNKKIYEVEIQPFSTVAVFRIRGLASFQTATIFAETVEGPQQQLTSQTTVFIIGTNPPDPP